MSQPDLPKALLEADARSTTRTVVERLRDSPQAARQAAADALGVALADPALSAATRAKFQAFLAVCPAPVSPAAPDTAAAATPTAPRRREAPPAVLPPTMSTASLPAPRLTRGLSAAATNPTQNPAAFWQRSRDEVLADLQQLSPEERSQQLQAASSDDRDRILGDTAFHPTRHDVGVAFDALDLQHFEPDGQPQALTNMAILAKRAYEDPKEVIPDLSRQGFDVIPFGHDNENDGYILHRGNQVFITLRGTIPSKFGDIQSDLNLLTKDGIHSGFSERADKLLPDLQRKLNSLTTDGPVHINITGHSMGAALAGITAERLLQSQPNAQIDGVYLFASPRFFSDEHGLAYNKVLGQRTYRPVVNCDWVTAVPPNIHYTHVGIPIQINKAGEIDTNMTDGQLLLNRTASSFSALANGRLEPLRDHSPVGYVNHLYMQSNQSFDWQAQQVRRVAEAVSGRDAYEVAQAMATLAPEARADVMQRFADDPVFARARVFWETGRMPRVAGDSAL